MTERPAPNDIDHSSLGRRIRLIGYVDGRVEHDFTPPDPSYLADVDCKYVDGTLVKAEPVKGGMRLTVEV